MNDSQVSGVESRQGSMVEVESESDSSSSDQDKEDD